MNKKIAILFYGQPRLIPNYTEPLNRLKQAFYDENISLEENQIEFDTYIHTWKNSTLSTFRGIHTEYIIDNNNYIFDFINSCYKPKKIIIEESKIFKVADYLNKDTISLNSNLIEKDISNFISQIYSINAVCNLVEEIDSYDFFVLVRFDLMIINFNKELFNKILNETNNLTNSTIIDLDMIQIFNKDTLNVYKHLISLNKQKTIRCEISPELLRYINLFEKPNYQFYGNFYFPKNHFKGFYIDCKHQKNEIIECQIIRNKEKVINLNIYPYFGIKPIWFQSSCGFLFFYINDKQCKIQKLKRHFSYVQKFDLNQLNYKITHIKLFNIWYRYDYKQSQEIIDKEDEIIFEIKF